MTSITTWTRLELSCRREDWMESLRARIHDPAWMLARQWQTGEFRGEDAGAPIGAEIAYRSSIFDRIRLGSAGQVSPLNQAAFPLETVVEAEPLPRSKRLAAQMGSYFERTLNDALRDKYRAAFPISWTAEEESRASDRAAAFMACVASRLTDGLDVLSPLRQGQSASAAYAATPHGQNVPLTQAEVAAADAAGAALLAWAATIYPDGAAAAAWSNPRQEYQFSVSGMDGRREIVLKAEEYYEGKLDWYAFTVDGSANAALDPNPRARQPGVEAQRAFIPSPIRFSGRPNERWWRFEDSKVNLAALDVRRSQLAHIVVSEFALVFANDWFELPLELWAGSLTKVTRLRVRDSFGGETDVPAMADENWSMFALSGRASATAPYTIAERMMMLPPTLVGVSESPALEECRLLRDEMANMAWAVETTVQDEIGVPVSGYDLSLAGQRRARERARLVAVEAVRAWQPFGAALEDARDQVIRRRGTNTEAAAEQALVTAENTERAPRAARDAAIAGYVALGGDARDLADLPDAVTEGKIIPTYKLLTEVPRNWIPFVPKATEINGQIMLRRGAMPDLSGAADNQVPPRVRPRGIILRPDIRPFLLFEEEVPKVGVHVTRTAQFARWLGGKSHFWIGRRKVAGRGEGWSGLKFDRVEDMAHR